MPKVFRHYSLYYKGRKVAMFSGNEETISSGDEAQIGDQGYEGHSDGAITTRLSSDAIIPVQGVGISVIEDMLAKKYVDIGMGIINGKIQKLTMRIVTATITSQASNGTQTGKFEFEGGKPELIG